MTVVLHAFPDEEMPARRLAGALGIDATFVKVHRYPDGELLPRIPPCADTTIVYRSLDRPNDKLIELVLAAEAWRRNGARRLVLAAPYLCYMRQDKAFSPGEAISQRAIGPLLGGIFDRIITVDAHLHRTPALPDVFPGRECTNLTGADAIARHIQARGTAPGLVVVGPDAESRQWAEAVAAPLGAACEVMTKERRGDATVIIHPPASFSVSHRPVLIVDDVASSGATLVETARLVAAAGASSLTVAVTHALFGEAVSARLRAVGVGTILSSDSCPHTTNAIFLAPLLAEALRSERLP